MAHFLKFLVVGTIGFIVNTVGLILGVRVGLRPSLSGPIGAEFAILSNFLLNNFWTFSDKKITSWQVLPIKFIQFNILSMASVVIQFLFLKVGEKIFGLEQFKKPLINWPVIRNFRYSAILFNWINKISLINKIAQRFSTYLIFYMAGVGVGLVVNFIIYSQVIWK